MKTSFSYNLLKHLRSKKAEGGFTLIELLVVIIIIGILAAIALPSFLNQANRARETEATNAIGALNRGQQAYYLEAVRFADTIDKLDVGINQQSENYTFAGDKAGANVGQFSGTLTGTGANAVMNAVPNGDKTIRGFSGVAYITTVNAKQQTTAKICRETASEANKSGLAGIATVSGGNATCETGTELVN